MLRRYTIVILLILLPNHTNTQILTQITSSLFMMSYTGYVVPFSVQRENDITLFDETIVLFISYHLFCFTEFVTDPQRR